MQHIIKEHNQRTSIVKTFHVLKIASLKKRREITLALLLRSMPDPPILLKWNIKNETKYDD